MSAAHAHVDGHRALVYDDPGTFVGTVAAFVRDGLSATDHVVAAVTSDKLGWLREELGSDAAAIEYLDAGGLYERHGPMFRSVLDVLERHGRPGRGRVRLVAEQPLNHQTPADLRAYMRYEAAATVAVDRYAASILCPYDAARLPEDVVDAALRTHPEVVEAGRPRGNLAFMDPRAFVRQHVRGHAAPPAPAACRVERSGDVAAVRAWIRTRAEAAGLPPLRVDDLTLAVSEIASNALLHGAEPRLLWSYVEDGHLVCQVRDGGPGPADPLVGYFPPGEDLLGGRGVWIAHQVCDIVEVAGRVTHTDVYLYMRLPGT